MHTFYVLTGGPGSGKSALIEALQMKGYLCVEEVARQIIQEQVEIGGEALPWINRQLFTELMLSRSILTYNITRKNTSQITLFDRGVVDVLGYAQLENLVIKDHYLNAVKKFRYNKKVFIAPPWEEIYVNDKERKQSFKEAIRVHSFMVKCYIEAGYDLVELPKCSIEERADFLVRNLV